MSDSSEGKERPSEWKPRIPKPRAPLRDFTMQTNQYSTLSSPGNHSFSSTNTSYLSQSASTEFHGSSDETDDYSDSDDQQDTQSAETSPISRDLHPHHTRSAALSNSLTEQIYKSHRQRHSGSISWRLIAFFGTIFCVLAAGGLHVIQKQNNPRLDVAHSTPWSAEKIRERFVNQNEELWMDVFSGINEALLHPEKPSIILLYGNESDTLSCLGNYLGVFSGLVLGTNQHLTLRPDDFKADVGEVIHDLKRPITLAKAVVVEDLLSINFEAFKAFHNFCDRENPLVEQAVYIITMVTSVPEGMANDLYAAEHILSERFGQSIKKDTLDALITRVTSGAVLRVAKETLQDCEPSSLA